MLCSWILLALFSSAHGQALTATTLMVASPATNSGRRSKPLRKFALSGAREVIILDVPKKESRAPAHGTLTLSIGLTIPRSSSALAPHVVLPCCLMQLMPDASSKPASSSSQVTPLSKPEFRFPHLNMLRQCPTSSHRWRGESMRIRLLPPSPGRTTSSVALPSGWLASCHASFLKHALLR